MEDTFLRFPHLGVAFFRELDNQSLTRSMEVGKVWNNFIKNQKFLYVRLIQEHNRKNDDKFSETWKKIITKTPTETMKQIAKLVDQFYRKKQIERYNWIEKDQWSPLHMIAAENNPHLYQYHGGISGKLNFRNFAIMQLSRTL